MGLIGPKDVGDFYFIRNPRKAGAKLRGERVDLNIDNILFANGQRTPTVATSPKLFTNAFILLTRAASNAENFARKIRVVRKRYTAAVATATGNRAKVITELVKQSAKKR